MSSGELDILYQFYCILLIVLCLVYAVYAFLKGIRHKQIKNFPFKNIAFSFFILMALMLMEEMYGSVVFLREIYRPILVCFALLFLVVGLFYPEKKIEEDEEFHNYVERKKWEKEQEKRKQQDLERQQQLKQAIEKSEQKKDDETP